MKLKSLLILVGLLSVPMLGRSENALTVNVVGLTNYVPATSTNSKASQAFDVRKYTTAAFYPRFRYTGAGAGTIRFRVDFAPDSTNYVTTTNHTFYVTGNGSTEVIGYEKVTLANCSFMKFAEIANTNSVGMTNFLNVKVVLE